MLAKDPDFRGEELADFIESSQKQCDAAIRGHEITFRTSNECFLGFFCRVLRSGPKNRLLRIVKVDFSNWTRQTLTALCIVDKALGSIVDIDLVFKSVVYWFH